MTMKEGFMREYSVQVRETFQNGLVPRKEITLNSPYLDSCYGFIPSVGGLTQNGVNLDAHGAGEWPFPQRIEGETSYFVFDPASVEVVKHMGGGLTSGSSHRLVSGTQRDMRWHLGDGYNGWIATNGGTVAYYKDTQVTTIAHPVSSAAFSRGRFWLGGFHIGEFSRQFWPSLNIDEYDNTYTNTVAWGSIGAAPNELLTDPSIERWRSNELGYIEVSDVGDVLAIRPFKDSMAVYGNQSVVLLRILEDGSVRQERILDVGIKSRDSVGGNDLRHLFVARDGRLISISLTGESSILEYGDHFQEDSYIVSLDPSDNLWYIGGLTRTGILRIGQGLGFSAQSITGLVYNPTRTLLGSMSPRVRSFEMVPIDFNRRDLKTVTGIQVFYSGSGRMEIGVNVRYDNESNWISGRFVPINSVGYARIQMSGVDFQVKFRTESPDIEIKSLDVRWQAIGKRFIRGPNPSPFNL